jgi:hypothetical protein
MKLGVCPQFRSKNVDIFFFQFDHQVENFLSGAIFLNPHWWIKKGRKDTLIRGANA